MLMKSCIILFVLLLFSALSFSQTNLQRKFSPDVQLALRLALICKSDKDVDEAYYKLVKEKALITLIQFFLKHRNSKIFKKQYKIESGTDKNNHSGQRIYLARYSIKKKSYQII